MTKEKRNGLVVIVVLIFPFLFFLGCLISGLTSPTPPLNQSLPNPNGYDDFVEAGKMVASDTGNFDEMNEQQLQSLSDENSNALQMARAGFQKQSRVPIQFSEVYITSHLNDLANLKRLAQAFAAAGKLNEMENRPGDAAKSYLDVIHLGNESSRGGTLIDELVGIAIESIGRDGLQRISNQLDAKSCRESAVALENLDSQRQTLNEVMQQENDWSHKTFPGIRYEIVRLMTYKSLLPAQAAARRKFNQKEVKTRQLIIDLAARAYELDKGSPPANISDLVPTYLKTIPQDPVTGTNMIYSPR
ncbi:MAG TPA: hypothetical protein VIK59_01365 [Verrucomicrobiae bacterium]